MRYFLLLVNHKVLPDVWNILDETLKSRCHEKQIDNPNDVQFLFTQYMQHLRQVLTNMSTEEKPTLWIDFTGGTKAMTAALVATGIALDADEVCYVVGPKNNPLGIVQKCEHVFRIEPQQILAARTISEARKLFNQRNYAAAVMTVQNVKNLYDKTKHLGDEEFETMLKTATFVQLEW